MASGDSKVEGEKKESGLFGFLKKNDDQGARKKVSKESTAALNVAPPLEEGFKEIEFIPINPPLTYVHILLNTKNSEYLYNVIEPVLSEREEETLRFLIETLNLCMHYDADKTDDMASKRTFIEEEIETIIKDYQIKLSSIAKSKIVYYIYRDFVGYGKMDVAMHDPQVEDVSCDGTEVPLFMYHKQYGSIKTNIIYMTDEELEGYVVALAQRCNKIISVAEPILDSTLPEGHRLNATLGREITTRGSSFSIRKFKEDPLTMTDLVKFNTLSPEMAAHLWMSVHYGESMICAGGSASGKTSTLNAVSLFIPPACKIISIEDTREVNLPHENWIAGVTRSKGNEDSPQNINMFKLLKAALRQRPEYVLVGEVRGAETMTMFQAMATGHITYSTMHADSVQSIVYRLENPPISIPRVLLSSLNLVVIHGQMRIRGKIERRITELVEIIGIEPTTMEVMTNKVYAWNPSSDSFSYGGHSNLYEKHMDRDDSTYEEVLEELNKRADIIRWMVRNSIRDKDDVSAIVAQYYEDPDKVSRMIQSVTDMKGFHTYGMKDETGGGV